MTASRYSFLAGALVLAVGVANAGVSPEEAERLGDELTPVGANPEGNEAGTIPEWDGGLTEGERPAKGEALEHPYADDEIRFTITGDNYQEYEDKLTPGQVAMFETYPETYEMNIYPTRRSAGFPERAYEWTRKNAVNAELDPPDNVTGARVGFPFPIPQSGEQAMKNHVIFYLPDAAKYYLNSAVVSQNGSYTLVRLPQEYLAPYTMADLTMEELYQENMQFYFLQKTVSPSRLAGGVILVHEPLDWSNTQRQAWAYNPGQRRVRRAPNLEFDNPGTGTDGLRTSDQNNVFNGSLGRYNWELVGKKEVYIPYNAYEIDERGLDYDKIVQAKHINQDLVRYELHRVWVVESRVQDDTSHTYARRTFYIDEDSWKIALVDIYDRRGNLWRFQEGHIKQYYHVAAPWYALEIVYDLQSQRYVTGNMDNNDPPKDWTFEAGRSRYTPGSLRRIGER